MRIEGRLSIAAAHLELPPGQQRIEDAVRGGALDRTLAELCDTKALPVAMHGESAESLALNAITAALKAASIEPQELDVLIHASMGDLDGGWKFAHRLSRRSGAGSALALGVRQLCNGGAMSVQLACSYLLAEASADNALIVTAEAPGAQWDRRWWLVETGAVYGDSATALVLARAPGPLRLCSICSSGRSFMEEAMGERNPFEVDDTAVQSLASSGGLLDGNTVFPLRKCVREVVHAALADAGLALGDGRLARVVISRVNSTLINTLILDLFPEARGPEIVHLSAETGHLFAGDFAANVAYLLERDPLEAGEFALVLNIGGGFTASAAVIAK